MAQQEILKVNLRDYKKEIDSLKASLLGLDRSSDEYAKTLSELQEKQQKLNQVTRDAKRDDDALEGSYNALVASMARLKEEWRATNDVAKRNELGQQIESINTQLKELDFSIGNSQRNVGNYESGTVSLRKQVKELRLEMENMLARGVSKTDAAYKALAKQAGEMQDAIDDAKSSVKEYADDVRGMSIGVDVAKNIAAGYGAATSAMELFGASTEDAQKITAKMTTIMALLNSLQQINTALMDSSSPTRKLAIELWQKLTGAKQKDVVATTQSTAAEVANNATVNAGTIAMNANKVATEGATMATKGFRKALISTGIGAVIVLIGVLIANFEKLSKWLVDIGEKLGLVDERLTKLAEQYNFNKEAAESYQSSLEKVNEEAAKGISLFKELRNEWEEARRTGSETEWLINNKTELENLADKLGLAKDSFTTLSGAEKIFIQAEDAVKKSFVARALQAEAAASSVRAYTAALEAEMYLLGKVEMDEDKLNDALARRNKELQTSNRLFNEANKLNTQANNIFKNLGFRTPTTNTAKSKTTSSRNTQKDPAEEARKKAVNEGNKAIDDLVKKQQTAEEKIQAEYDETVKKLTEGMEAELKATNLTEEQRVEITKKYNKARLAAEQVYQRELEKIIAEGIKYRENTEIESEKKALANRVRRLQYNNSMRNAYTTDSDQVAKNNYETEIAVIQANMDSLRKQKEILDRTMQAFEQNLREEGYTDEQIENIKNQSETYGQLKQAIDDCNESLVRFQEQENVATANFNKNSKKEKKETDKRKATFQEWSDKTVALIEAVASADKANIEARLKNDEITQKQAEKEFERVKAMQIATSIAMTIAGGVAAFMKDIETYMPPQSYAIAAIDMATTLAQGYAQVRAIQSQSIGSASMSNVAGGQGLIGVRTQPLLEEELDSNRLQSVQLNRIGGRLDSNSQKVFILQKDIADSQKQVSIREQNSTF